MSRYYQGWFNFGRRWARAGLERPDWLKPGTRKHAACHSGYDVGLDDLRRRLQKW